jgi:3-hydroxyisobutyrate dehydrogenase-like beta-hydroxyacid dehydrogenase
MYKVWSVSSGRSGAAAMPNLLKRDFDNPFFSLALSAKDIGLCIEAARDLEVPMTVSSAISQLFTRSLVKGYGNKSWFATMLTIEEEANVHIPELPDQPAAN